MTEQKSTITRRDFTQKSALGATAIASFSILNPTQASAQNAPLKVGLIGSGGRGTGAVQDAMKANENLELHAIHDFFESRVESSLRGIKRNEDFGNRVKVTPDTTFTGRDGYKKLVELDLDYVIIASPPGFKAEQFEAAVNAKKNIFCEKPVSTDSFGTRRYLAAAEKSEQLKLSVVTGLQRRHQKPYVETIQKIHDGALGEVLGGRAYWNGTLPWAHDRRPGESDTDYQIRNWYSFNWVCGDNIVEQHIHNLDIMNWVFDAYPVSVIASGGRTWKPKEEKYGNIWDSFSCDYEYPGGLHVMSFCRHWNNSYNEVSEWVIGSKGKSSNCHDMGDEGVNPYVQEHINLQKSITGDGPHLNEGVRVAKSTFTAIMGRMAAYSGQKISWDEALNANKSGNKLISSQDDLMPKNLSDSAKLPWDNIAVPGQA